MSMMVNLSGSAYAALAGMSVLGTVAADEPIRNVVLVHGDLDAKKAAFRADSQVPWGVSDREEFFQ